MQTSHCGGTRIHGECVNIICAWSLLYSIYAFIVHKRESAAFCLEASVVTRTKIFIVKRGKPPRPRQAVHHDAKYVYARVTHAYIISL